jgi:hypothetical protein
LPKEVEAAKTWGQTEVCAALFDLRAAKDQKALAEATLSFAVLRARQAHGPNLESAAQKVALLESQLEAYYQSHRPKDGAELLFYQGRIGMKKASQPKLTTRQGWDWSKVAARLKRSFKLKYFHPPAAPEIDKVKIKKELTSEQLEKHGLQLETTETFFVDLAQFNEAA